MPLYDCKCESCGRVEELLLKREEAPSACSCGNERIREGVQLPNFALKGGGWYKDGYSKGTSK